LLSCRLRSSCACMAPCSIDRLYSRRVAASAHVRNGSATSSENGRAM
jgi:hypothetical protein